MKYQFNDAQRNAVTHKDGPAMVIAGPGSGKTTVLTSRVSHLIENCRVNPADILVITFTKAAAVEMERRFNAMTGRKYKVSFGTFHAVFFKILRASYNYSVDNILKEDRRNAIIRQAVEKSCQDVEDMNEAVADAASEIGKVKSGGISISEYHSYSFSDSDFAKIYGYYCNALKRERLIDFDDILLQCHRLLSERTEVQKYWQKRYRYILIDEFQDINRVQYEVIKLLALPENNLFIVGDDDQSIYAFRGSDPKLMLGFQNDYPGCAKIVLDTNYRSSGNIVRASAKVISHNSMRFEKNLHTFNETGRQLEIIRYADERTQYRELADGIRADIDSGQNPSEIAILYRTNAIAEPLIRRLIEKNIDFSIKDGMPNIYDHWIAGDIFAYIRLVLGSRKRSDFVQVMNRPKRYIGRDYLNGDEVSFDGLIKLYEDKPWMIERIEQMESDIRSMGAMSPYAMINYLRRGVGYDDFLKEYAENHNIRASELYEKADIIQESAAGFKSFAAWFEYIEEYARTLKENAGKQGAAVALMTMHGAKGLEYDTVYIIDANEEITPHKKSVSEEEIEEERRMFYVAMTRARKRLTITFTKKRYNKEFPVSRFVTEIMSDDITTKE